MASRIEEDGTYLTAMKNWAIAEVEAIQYKDMADIWADYDIEPPTEDEFHTMRQAIVSAIAGLEI